MLFLLEQVDGLNIAHESIDRHVNGPPRDKVAPDIEEKKIKADER